MDFLSKLALVFVFIFIVVMGSMYSCSNFAYAGEIEEDLKKGTQLQVDLYNECPPIRNNPNFLLLLKNWSDLVTITHRYAEENDISIAESWEVGFKDQDGHAVLHKWNKQLADKIIECNGALGGSDNS